MAKFNNVWVITDSSSAIPELISGAKVFGEKVVLVYAGNKEAAVGADKAYYMDLDAQSVVNYSAKIVKMVVEAAPELVLLSNSKNGRLLAGQVAAAVGTTVFTDISSLVADENGLSSTRMVYGGSAIKTERSAHATVVACVGGGVFAVEELAPTADVEVLEAESKVSFIEKRPKVGKTVNLSLAKRIVCAGRGTGTIENLELLQKIAKFMEAEMGCTRPIAEEEKWMPVETYIGVSGVMLKPDVYLGAGVSGQIQHTVGINQSGVVFAINKDAKAPIFSQCDYGIVGDLKEVLPAIVERFESM